MQRDDDPDRERQRSQHGEPPDGPQLAVTRFGRQLVDGRADASGEYAKAPVGLVLQRSERHDRAVDPVAVAAGDRREQALEERAVGLELPLDGVEVAAELAGQHAGGLAPDRRERHAHGGAGLDEHGPPRAGERLEQRARRGGLPLVGDAVDERGERRLRRPKLGQAHRERDVAAGQLDAVVGGAALREDAPPERRGERDHGDRERDEYPPRYGRAWPRGDRVARVGRERQPGQRLAQAARVDRHIPVPQMTLMTWVSVPQVVAAAPPSPRSVAHAVRAEETWDEQAPVCDAPWHACTSAATAAWHAALLQAWNWHWTTGSSAAAHAGPIDVSARAMQPGLLSEMPVIPVASKITAPAFDAAPASVTPKRHETQPAFAMSIWNAAHPVAPAARQALRKPEICVAVHALSTCATGS